jgi:adenylate cyclase
LTEDIITALSRFKVVRDRCNSTFTYKGKAVDVREVGRTLGVRYVMEGSASGQTGAHQRAVDRHRDRRHLWAERYDRDLSDIFALQDEVTRDRHRPQGPDRRGDARGTARTANVEAYDFCCAAVPTRSRRARDQRACRRMIEKAIELDPNFAEAYAELSKVHWQDWFFRWSLDPLTSTAPSNGAAGGGARR